MLSLKRGANLERGAYLNLGAYWSIYGIYIYIYSTHVKMKTIKLGKERIFSMAKAEIVSKILGDEELISLQVITCQCSALFCNRPDLNTDLL